MVSPVSESASKRPIHSYYRQLASLFIKFMLKKSTATMKDPIQNLNITPQNTLSINKQVVEKPLKNRLKTSKNTLKTERFK